MTSAERRQIAKLRLEVKTLREQLAVLTEHVELHHDKINRLAHRLTHPLHPPRPPMPRPPYRYRAGA